MTATTTLLAESTTLIVDEQTTLHQQTQTIEHTTVFFGGSEAGSSNGIFSVVNEFDADHDVVLADGNKYIRLLSNEFKQIHFQLDATVQFPVGQSIQFVNIGNNPARFDIPLGGTINSQIGSLVQLEDKGDALIVVYVGDNSWDVFGDITAYTLIVSARYVRVRILENAFGNATAIATMEARATFGGADMCVGGTPLASDQRDGSTGADKAFDGNAASKWISNNAALPHWIQYDLGSVKTIRQIAITA